MAFARTTAALVLLAGLACEAHAQTYLKLAATPDVDYRPCGTMLSDGGRAIAHGRADPLTGSTDFQVTRFDAAGAVVWSRQIVSAFSETPTAVLELPSGDLVVVGSTFPSARGDAQSSSPSSPRRARWRGPISTWAITSTARARRSTPTAKS